MLLIQSKFSQNCFFFQILVRLYSASVELSSTLSLFCFSITYFLLLGQPPQFDKISLFPTDLTTTGQADDVYRARVHNQRFISAL